METIALLIGLAGLVLMALGVIGFFKRKVPLLNMTGRRKAALIAGAGFLLGGLGGALLPTNKVIITATPRTATITVDGQTYTGTTGQLALTGDTYTVKVSAPGYHAITGNVNVKTKKDIQITLKPVTAAEKAAAAQKAAAEAKRQAEARAQQERAAEAQRKQEAAAAAAAAAQERQQQLASEPVPSEAEISVMSADDNMGVNAYFILTDANDQEIAVTGKANLVLTVSDYSLDYGETEQVVYNQSWDVSADSYLTGTRGMGAFKRDALFFSLGKVNTENISGKHGNAKFTFTYRNGMTIKAKDSVFYP